MFSVVSRLQSFLCVLVIFLYGQTIMCVCLVHVSISADRFYIYCFKNLFSSEKFIERTGGPSPAHQR